MIEDPAENDASAMPMCDRCLRPLGLFYAECLTCLDNAGLGATYYHAWCKWQMAQRATPPDKP